MIGALIVTKERSHVTCINRPTQWYLILSCMLTVGRKYVYVILLPECKMHLKLSIVAVVVMTKTIEKTKRMSSV